MNMAVQVLPASTLRLQCRGIGKRYPGVVALDAVNLEVRPGEVHVLFGENGAGKSTLISIIAGAQRGEGSLMLDGKEVVLQSVQHARSLGISAVFQEFSLVPQMTVAQNLFLGAEQTVGARLDRAGMHNRARQALAELGFDIDPDRPVQELTRGEQQMVEICKAFQTELSVLILDEPTASLTENEKNKLFALVRKAKANGVGIIYISHRMHELAEIGDRITILRDGRLVSTVPSSIEHDKLVELMTGRQLEQVYPQVMNCPGKEILNIRGLHTHSGLVCGADISVKAGEIVGIAGLVGCGKSELGRACFGIERLKDGAIHYQGRPLNVRHPRDALREGIFYLTSDRKNEGLLLHRSCQENLSLSALHRKPVARGWLLDKQNERTWTARLAERVGFAAERLGRNAHEFSGGNQQKVLLAKGLTQPVDLYIFDEPTVGVDVMTRAAIYRFFKELCEAGAAILLISSDLSEVMNLSQRLYVMREGKVVAELCGEDINEHSVLSHFFEEHRHD
ncbi:Arabinose import ATP-binding protein AraG [compost metagenome]